jgi:regulator of chromosome condensation
MIEFNEVLSFGSGDMSQLGLGAGSLERKNPAPIKALEGMNVVAIASGALHNAALTDDGQVWTWGCNDDHGMYVVCIAIAGQAL